MLINLGTFWPGTFWRGGIMAGDIPAGTFRRGHYGGDVMGRTDKINHKILTVCKFHAELGNNIRVQVEEADAKFLLALNNCATFGNRRFN